MVTIEDLPADLVGLVIPLLHRDRVIPFSTASDGLVWKVAQTISPWEPKGALRNRLWETGIRAELELLAARNEFLQQIAQLGDDERWTFHVRLAGLSDALVALLSRVTTIEIRSCLSLSDQSLANAAARMPLLTTLSVSNVTGLTDAALEGLQNASKLTTLDVSNNRTLTDRACASIAKCTQLRHLSIASCTDITDDGVALLANLHQLETLDASYLYKVFGEGLQFVEKCVQLKSLKLVRTHSMGDVGIKFISKSTSLTELDCTSLTSVTGAGWLHLAHASTSLKTLVLSFTKVEDSALAVIGAKFTALKWLEIAVADGISDISALGTLLHLRKLDLDYAERVADFKPLCALTNVAVLNLRHCKLLRDDDVLAICAALTCIVSLKVSGNDLSDAAFTAFQKLTQLQDLDASECCRLTDVALEHISSATSIKRLNITGCSLMTDNGMITLMKRLANLGHLEAPHSMLTDNSILLTLNKESIRNLMVTNENNSSSALNRSTEDERGPQDFVNLEMSQGLVTVDGLLKMLNEGVTLRRGHVVLHKSHVTETVVALLKNVNGLDKVTCFDGLRKRVIYERAL